jgi:4-hydroxybenzoate polyprenyltransferase
MYSWSSLLAMVMLAAMVLAGWLLSEIGLGWVFWLGLAGICVWLVRTWYVEDFG